MVKVQTIGELSQRYLSANPIVRNLSNLSGVAFFGYSPRHRCLLWWTDNLADLLGTSQAQLMRSANLFLRHTHEEDRFRLISELEKAFSGTQPYRVTYRWITPNSNKCLWLHCRAALRQKSVYPIFEGFIVNMHDEQAAHSLADHSSLASAPILEAMACSSLVLDHDYRVEFAVIHQEAQCLFSCKGIDEVQSAFHGKLLTDCLEDKSIIEFAEQAFNAISKQSIAQTAMIDRFRVELSPLSQDHSMMAYLLQIHDASPERALQKELEELGKAEASRSITASVLHNVSNVLQSMVGELQTLHQHHHDGLLVKKLSETLLERVVRLSNLSSQARKLENESSPIAQEVDLNLCLLVALQQAQRTLHSLPKISMHFGDPPQIFIRQSKLVQSIKSIIEHISLYGAPAMLEVASSWTNDTASITITSTFAAPHNHASSCEEFFRTTEIQETRQFISDSDGYLELKTNAPDNFEIQISFPSSSQQNGGEHLLHEVQAPEVMVVDDDPLVLECFQAMCVDLGYPCITAQNGLDALRLIHAHHKTLQLAFVDGLLPGMNGATIVRKLKAINPQLLVVGISGAAAEVFADMERAGAAYVLSKPVSLEMLRNELAQIKTRWAVG
ncbi:MAG: response regulator [Bdellovibrionales bacterium]|nr:response regulator [Bdellovibrionales bacterium]